MLKTRFLKVKIKALAAEARIIRIEELRSHGELRSALYKHRVYDVRAEARATQIAYGYLRGRLFIVIEPNAQTVPDWKRVEAMVKKYGTSEQLTDLAAWHKDVVQIAA